MKNVFLKILTLMLAVTMLFESGAVLSLATPVDPDSSQSEGQLSSISITSIAVVNGGVSVKWGTLPTAVRYELYAKRQSITLKLYDGKEAVFTDKSASNGSKSVYFVKAFDAEENCLATSADREIIYYAPAAAPLAQVENSFVSLSWKKENVAKYRIIRKANGEASFKKIADVFENSYVDKTAKAGNTYYYAVQYLDKDGEVLNLVGNAAKLPFVKALTFTSVQSSFGSVYLKWKKQSGASKYAVYRKTASTSFKKLTVISGTSYNDKSAKSGTTYTYALVCLDGNNRPISTLGAAKSVKYIKAPKISKIKNNESGSTVTWKKVSGVSKYRVYVLSKKSWKSIGTTASTSLEHKSLKNKTKYTYTIRGLDSKGKAVTGFDPKGTENLFLSPIKISSVSRAKKANVIKWKKVTSAAKYTLYRQAFGESRKKLAEVKSLTYSDKKAKSNVAYTYTVVAQNKNGTAITSYNSGEKYYVNGKTANGIISLAGAKCGFKNGVPTEKLKTKSGAMYYYNADGKLMKNGIVGSSAMGYYYADKSGKINLNYCGAVKQGAKQWNVVCGKASVVSNEKDKTLNRALAIVEKITTPSMTKEQKLKICFDYVKKTYCEFNPRVPHYHGDDWTVVYANDMFVGKGGNCFSYACAFAYMAKGIGYENVYCCNSGGHGWAEINGLIYDPEWSMHSKASTYYGVSYSSKPVAHYKGAIGAGKPWMHVKI